MIGVDDTTHDAGRCGQCLGTGWARHLYLGDVANIPCASCDGRGRTDERPVAVCDKCDGTGRALYPRHEELCPKCVGRGREPLRPGERLCDRCSYHEAIVDVGYEHRCGPCDDARRLEAVRSLLARTSRP